MQLRGFHAALEERVEAEDSMEKKKGKLKTAADYGHAMQRLMRYRSYSRILHLFERMKSNGVTIDVRIYTAVMKVHSRMNNMDMVKRIFDDVIASGLEPNIYLFNTLIHAYTNTGEIDAAFEAFHKMQKDYKILPDPVPYRSLITVCSKGKDVNRARETFDEMNEKFVGHVRGYNTMLEVYAENGDSDTAEAFLEECHDLMATMSEKGIKPQVLTYVPLIKLYAKLGRSKEALGYFKESVGDGAEPTLTSFDTVLRSLADLEITDEEVETHIVYCLNRIKELKLTPVHSIFGGILKLYEGKRGLSKALGFFKKLSEINMKGAGRCGENYAVQLELVQRLWDNGTYSQVEALAKVSEVVESMKTSRIDLSHRGYKIWVTMCFKASDVERALECWSDFKAKHHRPSAEIVEPVIRLLLDQDRVDDAVQVLKDVQNAKKTTPIEGLYEAVLAYCAEKSDTENAKTILEYMKEAEMRPNETIQEHLDTLQLV